MTPRLVLIPVGISACLVPFNISNPMATEDGMALTILSEVSPSGRETPASKPTPTMPGIRMSQAEAKKLR